MSLDGHNQRLDEKLMKNKRKELVKACKKAVGALKTCCKCQKEAYYVLDGRAYCNDHWDYCY